MCWVCMITGTIFGNGRLFDHFRSVSRLRPVIDVSFWVLNPRNWDLNDILGLELNRIWFSHRKLRTYSYIYILTYNAHGLDHGWVAYTQYECQLIMMPCVHRNNSRCIELKLGHVMHTQRDVWNERSGYGGTLLSVHANTWHAIAWAIISIRHHFTTHYWCRLIQKNINYFCYY